MSDFFKCCASYVGDNRVAAILANNRANRHRTDSLYRTYVTAARGAGFTACYTNVITNSYAASASTACNGIKLVIVKLATLGTTDNSGVASLILSCEISGMSQSANGAVSDYLVISSSLLDPDSNEVVWEDAYEVKRLSRAGIVYR